MTAEFIATLKSSGGDFSTIESALSSTGLGADYSVTTTRVFRVTSRVGAVAQGASVTGATSGATGVVQCLNVANTHVLLKTVSGNFVVGEQMRVDVSNYLVLGAMGNRNSADCGDLAQPVLEVYRHAVNGYHAPTDTISLTAFTFGTALDRALFIRAAPGHEWTGGKPGDVVGETSAYFRLPQSAGASSPFYIASSSHRMRFRGFGVGQEGGANSMRGFQVATTSQVLIERCWTRVSLEGFQGHDNTEWRNCLAIGGTAGFLKTASRGPLALNCTAVSCTIGFDWDAGGTQGEISNCLAYSCTTDYTGTALVATAANNATSAGTTVNVPGASAVASVGATDMTDVANNDYRCATGTSLLKAAGVDRSARVRAETHHVWGADGRHLDLTSWDIGIPRSRTLAQSLFQGLRHALWPRSGVTTVVDVRSAALWDDGPGSAVPAGMTISSDANGHYWKTASVAAGELAFDMAANGTTIDVDATTIAGVTVAAMFEIVDSTTNAGIFGVNNTATADVVSLRSTSADGDLQWYVRNNSGDVATLTTGLLNGAGTALENMDGAARVETAVLDFKELSDNTDSVARAWFKTSSRVTNQPNYVSDAGAATAQGTITYATIGNNGGVEAKIYGHVVWNRRLSYEEAAAVADDFRSKVTDALVEGGLISPPATDLTATLVASGGSVLVGQVNNASGPQSITASLVATSGSVLVAIVTQALPVLRPLVAVKNNAGSVQASLPNLQWAVLSSDLQTLVAHGTGLGLDAAGLFEISDGALTVGLVYHIALRDPANGNPVGFIRAVTAEAA
jgi:hypothetical protein